jgi:5'-nucleotidase
MEELRMNRRNFIKNISAGTVGISLGAVPLGLLAHEDFVTISILHTNDIHCHIEPFTSSNEKMNGKGGLARIAQLAKLEREKNKNTFLFDAGDMFQGTPYFNYFKGELMLKTMSAAGYDAGTVGNHEFDNGLEGLLNPLPNAKFPIVNSNYDFSDTILHEKFPKWLTFKRSGIKIGVYGLGIELDGLVGEKHFGDTLYKNPLSIATEMESFLKNEQKCDLVICLSHLGLKYKDDKVSDLVVAKETNYTDLIIGGHTHTYLEEPLIEENKSGDPVIVNQAWWGGLVVGKIEFVFERSRRIKKATFTKKIST